MKNLEKYSVQELLEQFRNACLDQYETYMGGKISKYNKLQDFLLSITRELKSRGTQERLSLLTLLDDENPQVRLQAATKVYSVAPVKAKACLEAISSSRHPDVSLAAGMTLWRLEEVPNCLDWI